MTLASLSSLLLLLAACGLLLASPALAEFAASSPRDYLRGGPPVSSSGRYGIRAAGPEAAAHPAPVSLGYGSRAGSDSGDYAEATYAEINYAEAEDDAEEEKYRAAVVLLSEADAEPPALAEEEEAGAEGGGEKEGGGGKKKGVRAYRPDFTERAPPSARVEAGGEAGGPTPVAKDAKEAREAKKGAGKAGAKKKEAKKAEAKKKEAKKEEANAAIERVKEELVPEGPKRRCASQRCRLREARRN